MFLTLHPPADPHTQEQATLLVRFNLLCCYYSQDYDKLLALFVPYYSVIFEPLSGYAIILPLGAWAEKHI